MKKVANVFLALILVAAISGGVSYLTFSYLSETKGTTSGVTGTSNKSTLVHSVSGKAMGTSAYEQDFTVIAENAVHAVVHIKSTVVREGRRYINPFEFYFGGRGYYQEPPQKQEGYGSGVIITNDGYIVTNNHVIEGADEINVSLNDKRSFKAKLIGTDPSTDIALLKIEAENLPIIPFGDSDALKVGEWVLAVGNPFNLTSTVTAGIVSAKARNLSASLGGGTGSERIESFIQTDAAVNPGNSGGALVNTRGELVGINTAITSQTGNFAGHSFAVPTSIVSKVIDDLKQFGLVQRAVMGVSISNITPELQKEKKITTLDGVYVVSVENLSAALKAGIEAGDVLTAVNGTSVSNSAELIEQMNRYRPGDVVNIDLLRDGKVKTVSVELMNSRGSTELIKENSAETILGAKFEMLSDKEMRQIGVNYGVKVTSVSNGKLKNAGVTKGFVVLKINNSPVKSPEDVVEITNSILQGGAGFGEQAMFVVGIKPNGRSAYLAIDLSEN